MTGVIQTATTTYGCTKPKLSSRERRYQQRKALGQCVDCKAALPDHTASVRCVTCKSRQLESQTRYLKTERGRKFNTRLGDVRAQRRKAGLCSRCGGARDSKLLLCLLCNHKLGLNRRGVSGVAAVLPVRMPTIRHRSLRTSTLVTPRGWTVEADIREELLALSELVALRRVS